MRLILPLLFALPIALGADVVVTRDGRRLVGEVLRRDGRVIVRMKLGSVALESHEVLRIEPGEGFLAEFDRRRAALQPGDRAARLALAGWARERGLRGRALALYRELARAGEPAARNALVDLLLEEQLSRGGAPDKALAAELSRHPQAVAAWLGARYSSRSKELAARLAEDGPPDAAACAALYRRRRQELLLLVQGSGFDDRAPRALRDRALALYRGLAAIYERDALRPFLLVRHAARLEELRALEELALRLGATLPAESPHEAALDAVRGVTDRAALDRSLALKARAVAAGRSNAGFPGAGEAELALVGLINRYRDMLGLSTLVLERRLCQASEAHTRDMLQRRFFGHDSPAPRRRAPTDRVRATGYPWGVVGEVLARKSTDPRAVFEAFLHSPTHHRTLVHPAFREIGIGKVRDYWTLELAVRR